MAEDRETLLTTSRFHVVECQRQDAEGRTLSRQIVRHPGAVAILPVVDADHICLIRNYRISVDQTLIELPAGTLEAGEDPRVAAQRELAEETGYTARQMDLLHEFFLSPGILDERMHLFVATGLLAGRPQLEVGEQIETQVVAFQEALDMIRNGTIQDAKTIIGLLWYDRLQRKKV